MVPPNPAVPRAAQPKYSSYFDAFNSSSTGHQRTENRLGSSMGWRESRAMKLSSQFKSHGAGGERIADKCGQASEDWDEEVRASMLENTSRKSVISKQNILIRGRAEAGKNQQLANGDTVKPGIVRSNTHPPPKRRIFDSLVIHINGSMQPLISDHKLKRLLVENGATISIHLVRRQVTHVILGRPCISGLSLGSGGGLAAAKIQKEIKTIGGCCVKYVGVEWVLESVRVGKRLAEVPFSNLKLAASGQQSVYNMFTKARGGITGDQASDDT